MEARAKDFALISQNQEASPEQVEAWVQYKKFRNKINNRKKNEEHVYKSMKITENLESPSKTWKTAKMFMNWKTTGSPHQLEVNGRLITSSGQIASVMNDFFIDKVRRIRGVMAESVENFTASTRIML